MIRLLILFVFAPLLNFAQSKHTKLFIEAGMSGYSSAYKSYNIKGSSTAPVVALTCNYVPRKKLGVGISLEGGGIETVNNSGELVKKLTVALLSDWRYYLKFKRNLFIPFAQLGYNFYHSDFQYSNSTYTIAATIKNAGQFASGLAYQYVLLKNGGGPLVALKYSYQRYNTDVKGNLPGITRRSSGTLHGAILTLGFKI